MKKIFLSLFICSVLGAGFLSAETAAPADDSSKLFRVDVGAGLTFGLFDTSAAGNYSGTVGFLATLLSLRGGANADLRIQTSEDLSFGASVGAYSMQLSINGSTITFLDLPVRALVRYGKGGTYIEGYGGYLITSGTSLNGLELGARGSLGGVYAEYSYVMGTVGWSKIGLGFNVTDIFKF